VLCKGDDGCENEGIYTCDECGKKLCNQHYENCLEAGQECGIYCNDCLENHECIVNMPWCVECENHYSMDDMITITDPAGNDETINPHETICAHCESMICHGGSDGAEYCKYAGEDNCGKCDADSPGIICARCASSV
jgi:hypothetical protein